MNASAKGLVDARIELHWAAQIASAAGATLVPPEPDAAHTSLGWDEACSALVGHEIGGRRAGLRLRDATIVVLEGSQAREEHALAGETVDGALGWLAQSFGVAKLTRPEHDLPPHAVATGGTFTVAEAAALSALSEWFALAHAVLDPIASGDFAASPVRCWPHHFDIATLIALDGPSKGEAARTIGVGLSPGDASYAEPYFYVTPWPYPSGDLPALARGAWHHAGWTGAVLLGSELAAVSKPADRAPAATEFLRGALDVCRSILG